MSYEYQINQNSVPESIQPGRSIALMRAREHESPQVELYLPQDLRVNIGTELRLRLQLVREVAQDVRTLYLRDGGVRSDIRRLGLTVFEFEAEFSLELLGTVFFQYSLNVLDSRRRLEWLRGLADTSE
jgi:hypothetical protein